MAFNIIKEEPSERSERPLSSRESKKKELQARLDRAWIACPEKHNPTLTAIGRKSLARAWDLLTSAVDVTGKKTADLGCGAGYFSRMLRDHGAQVDAVDLSSNALKAFREIDAEGIQLFQEFIPYTKLPDEGYDIVVSLDIIANLYESDLRIYFSELCRLIKHDGYVLCATPIDYHSEDALHRFAYLAGTEFEIVRWKFCYDSFFVRVCNFLAAPGRFAKAGQDPEYRKKSLAKRYAFMRWWFAINSLKVPSLFWKGVALLTEPLACWAKNNDTLMNALEKVARLFRDERAITHAIFIGKRKPLEIVPKEEELVEIRKGKREVWE